VVIHSNPSFTIAPPKNPKESNQCWRAAAIAVGALRFNETIVRGDVSLEYNKASLFLRA
jgi:hypothetical protein